MNPFATIREHWHPLHRARRWSWFQSLQSRWDPMIPTRLPFLRKPIYVRFLAHAAFWLGKEGVEEEIRATFCKWMESPDAQKGFWDVGANIGVFSFTYANTFPDAPLLSFEPDRRNLECLRRTMAVWKSPSHTLIPAAVSDQAGQASFTIDRLSGATGSLVQDNNTFNERHYAVKGRTETVDLVRLDDFYEPGNAPGLVKIDVEGAETSVLRGATRLLSEDSPVLLFESFTQGEECQRLLAPFHYAFFDSDRFAPASGETTNFLALATGKTSPDLIRLLREIGYPL